MVFENFSEYMARFSLDQILSGDFSAFVPIFYLAVSMAIYAVFIWHFYRFIARRDCFKLSTKRRHPKVISFLKYFSLFPFVAFLFFIGLSLIMYFLTKNYSNAELLATSFAIIMAIRITAYYSEDLSKDLAKMLPFALLGIFLVDPSYFDIGSPHDIVQRLIVVPDFLYMGIQYILFIILIEWILRILLNIRYALIPPKKTAPSENQQPSD